ncbi:hypothetical protein EII11_01925 [Schaalia canis]|uniref:Uncharacterized protein n=1 Tax=Schaalia canis TaxID=100469 RepID=A0A3P1SGL1_9ACTO|nr:hypothetical protein EII11_01925 [Schaalia canis]
MSVRICAPTWVFTQIRGGLGVVETSAEAPSLRYSLRHKSREVKHMFERFSTSDHSHVIVHVFDEQVFD